MVYVFGSNKIITRVLKAVQGNADRRQNALIRYLYSGPTVDRVVPTASSIMMSSTTSDTWFLVFEVSDFFHHHAEG